MTQRHAYEERKKSLTHQTDCQYWNKGQEVGKMESIKQRMSEFLLWIKCEYFLKIIALNFLAGLEISNVNGLLLRTMRHQLIVN